MRTWYIFRDIILPVPKGWSITLLYLNFPIKFVEQLVHRFLMIGYKNRQTEIAILVSWIRGESRDRKRYPSQTKPFTDRAELELSAADRRGFFILILFYFDNICHSVDSWFQESWTIFSGAKLVRSCYWSPGSFQD